MTTFLVFFFRAFSGVASVPDPTEPPGACEMRRTIGAVWLKGSGPGAVTIARSGLGSVKIKEV